MVSSKLESFFSTNIMASFEKVGKKWKAIIRKKGFPKKTKTFDTKREASAWAFEYEQNLKANSGDEILKSLTFATLIKRYLAEVSIHKKSAKQETNVLNRFMREFPDFANKTIADITPLDVAKWKEKRGIDVMSSTVARDWSRLSAIFSHAIKSWGLPLRENPFFLVTKPKESKPRNQRINNDDIDDFLEIFDFTEQNEVKTTRQKTAWCFLFAIETGMRAGEILKLKNENINGRIATLLDTKNGEDRKVPLSTKAMRLIEILPDGLPVGISSEVLDATFRKHRPPHLRHINFHDTRHEALSRLAKKIQNPMDLAKISGHKDLKILLNTYYNPDDDHLVSLLYEEERDVTTPKHTKLPSEFRYENIELTLSNNLMENKAKLLMLGCDSDSLMLGFYVKTEGDTAAAHVINININDVTIDKLRELIHNNIPSSYNDQNITIENVSLHIIDPSKITINKSIDIDNDFN